MYGESESRTSVGEIEAKWQRIETEIKKIELRGESFILIGDYNKHVGNIIKDNHDKVTYGGKLVRNFLHCKDYVLLNASKKVVGGPFTRHDPGRPHDESKKSCIDLMYVCMFNSQRVSIIQTL